MALLLDLVIKAYSFQFYIKMDGVFLLSLIRQSSELINAPFLLCFIHILLAYQFKVKKF